MSLVLGIDPATKTPGYALCDMSTARLGEGRVPLQRLDVLEISTDPIQPHWEEWFDYAICEDQYMGKAGKKSVSTLSRNAGFRLGSCFAKHKCFATPKAWRTALFGASISKAVSNARVYDNLTTTEKNMLMGLPEARHGDILDAIGLCWAFPLMKTKEYN